MAIDSDTQNLILERANQAQKILVIINHQAKPELISAAASFFLSLKATFGEKSIFFLSPAEISAPSLSQVAGLDQIQSELGNKNLQISFDYTPEKVDKVNYHIDEESQKFYLVVEPQSGHQPLNPDSVEFSLTGADADLVFMFGVADLDSLEQLYLGYERLYQDTTLISLHSFLTEVGDIKIDLGDRATLSESVWKLISDFGWQITPEVATNLLYGIDMTTNNLTSLVASADTFEAVSHLLRSGARRIKANQEKSLSEVKKPAPITSVTRSTSKTIQVGGLDHKPGDFSGGK